uniref:GDNF/GAS1 domain-containing protein n=1 Tax=Neogobius melanostomus TaxID=47308 RepID=A0A8C6SLB9_9GOBI
MSLASVLGQFPSLRACVCEQEADLCDSIPALLAQCHQKPAVQWQRISKNDWQLSTLLDMDHDASESCLESIRRCLGDSVCNRLMAPVLQQCMGLNCEHHRCQEATVSFYRSMPLHIAQLLVMCQCQDSDEACVRMSSALHSGTCGAERRSCLHTARQCVGDTGCRRQLSVLQSRCWRSVEPHCLNNLHTDECFSQMKPALILGAYTECQSAFLDTVGTTLHFPCTCEGLLSPDLQTCAIIHEVFHNRTPFIKQWKDSKAPTKPPDRSDDILFDWSDYLLSGFACLLLMGITVS